MTNDNTLKLGTKLFVIVHSVKFRGHPEIFETSTFKQVASVSGFSAICVSVIRSKWEKKISNKAETIAMNPNFNCSIIGMGYKFLSSPTNEIVMGFVTGMDFLRTPIASS